jgi:hypothetical protein
VVSAESRIGRSDFLHLGKKTGSLQVLGRYPFLESRRKPLIVGVEIYLIRNDVLRTMVSLAELNDDY